MEPSRRGAAHACRVVVSTPPAPQPTPALAGHRQRRRLRLPKRDEDGDAGFGADLARDVALAGDVFGDQDVAGTESADGAVADFDIDGAREREDCRAAGRVVPGIGSSRLEAANDDAAARDQFGALGLVAARPELRHDLLEVRLAVGTGVDADDGHWDLPALKVASTQERTVALVWWHQERRITCASASSPAWEARPGPA